MVIAMRGRVQWLDAKMDVATNIFVKEPVPYTLIVMNIP